LIITILGVWEFYGLSKKDRAYPLNITGLIASVILFLSISLTSYNPQQFPLQLLAINFISIFLIFIHELYRKKNSPFVNVSYTLLGPLYIALPLGLLNYLAFFGEDHLVYNPTIIIGYFIILWTNDSGAYVFGSKFGKTKLFKRISPKKSWEGCIGGGLFSLLAGFICFKAFGQLSVFNWLMIALITVVFGTLGDLVESMFKRSINVKDSGSILPGHGGILDRFDAVFISVPFVYAYLALIS
jgi:phosphatidate cytidylyltransferase